MTAMPRYLPDEPDAEEPVDLGEVVRTHLQALIERDGGGLDKTYGEKAGVSESTVWRAKTKGFKALSNWGEHVRAAGGRPEELLYGPDGSGAQSEADRCLAAMEPGTRELAMAMLRKLAQLSDAACRTPQDLAEVLQLLEAVPPGPNRDMTVQMMLGAARTAVRRTKQGD